MTIEDPLLRDEVAQGVVRLTFNRPEKMNALSTDVIERLDAALNSVAVDRAVRVLVLAGAGGRSFIAGADIAEYAANRDAAFAAYQFASRRVFDKLEALPKPTIAAVRGYALGGGLEIALCCDVLICTESARLGLPEGRLGLSPGGGGTQRLTRAVGRYVAADMMLAGWRITGERAYQLGLAAEVCADEALDETVLTRAHAMLKVAPGSQTEIKRLIRQGFDAPLPVAQSLEQEVLLRLYRSHDGQEGIAAFLEKREPRFRGE
jgi:enoyl-CoA hydratase/carnithine racemase